MALFKISKGASANLPTDITEGYCWYTYDDSKFYIDYKDENGELRRNALNAKDAETLSGASLATILRNSEVEIPTSKLVYEAINEVKSLIGDKSISEQVNEAIGNVFDAALFFKHLKAQMPVVANWSDITYGDGMFVAIAYDSNVAAYSTDGKNWSFTTLPSTEKWTKVKYGMGVFIAISYFSNVCAYSSDGINWSQGTTISTLKWTSLVFDGSYYMFYAVPEEGMAYKYTMDGYDWGMDELPIEAQWSDMTFDGSECIIVARNSKQILIGHLASWTARTHNSPASGLIAVASNGNGLTVALGTLGSGYVCWTTDKSTWNNAFISEKAWCDIAYGNGKFVTVAINTNCAAYSEDGEHWTEVELPCSCRWKNVSYGNGMFIACAYETNVIAISSDGVKWVSSEKMLIDKSGNDVTQDVLEILNVSNGAPKLATVTLNSENWSGSSNPYYQNVAINGVTNNSKIDLQPSASQIVELQNEDIMIMIENNNGAATAYAIGGKPTKNYTMQALITEVIPV